VARATFIGHQECLIVLYAIIVYYSSIITALGIYLLLHVNLPVISKPGNVRTRSENCVGKRNYRFFVLFVWSAIFNCMVVCSLTIYHLITISQQMGNGVIGALSTAPISGILFIYCLIVVLSVLVLGGFHAYLVAIGQTTNEDIKKLFKTASHSPYYRGICGNILLSLCGPRYPSVINFQEEVVDMVFDEVVVYHDTEEEDKFKKEEQTPLNKKEEIALESDITEDLETDDSTNLI